MADNIDKLSDAFDAAIKASLEQTDADPFEIIAALQFQSHHTFAIYACQLTAAQTAEELERYQRFVTAMLEKLPQQIAAYRAETKTMKH